MKGWKGVEASSWQRVCVRGTGCAHRLVHTRVHSFIHHAGGGARHPSAGGAGERFLPISCFFVSACFFSSREEDSFPFLQKERRRLNSHAPHHIPATTGAANDRGGARRLPLAGAPARAEAHPRPPRAGKASRLFVRLSRLFLMERPLTQHVTSPLQRNRCWCGSRWSTRASSRSTTSASASGMVNQHGQ